MAVMHEIKEKEFGRVLANEMRFITSIKGKPRLVRIRNTELRKGIIKYILRWFGNANKMELDIIS